MLEAKYNGLLVSKADLEEVKSQLAQKNMEFSSEIEQLKVTRSYFVLLYCFNNEQRILNIYDVSVDQVMFHYWRLI